jgi:hypothetical protein
LGRHQCLKRRGCRWPTVRGEAPGHYVHQEAPDEVPYFHCREFLEKNSRKSVGKPHISKVLYRPGN